MCVCLCVGITCPRRLGSTVCSSACWRINWEFVKVREFYITNTATKRSSHTLSRNCCRTQRGNPHCWHCCRYTIIHTCTKLQESAHLYLQLHPPTRMQVHNYKQPHTTIQRYTELHTSTYRYIQLHTNTHIYTQLHIVIYCRATLHNTRP